MVQRLGAGDKSPGGLKRPVRGGIRYAIAFDQRLVRRREAIAARLGRRNPADGPTFQVFDVQESRARMNG